MLSKVRLSYVRGVITLDHLRFVDIGWVVSQVDGAILWGDPAISSLTAFFGYLSSRLSDTSRSITLAGRALNMDGAFIWLLAPAFVSMNAFLSLMSAPIPWMTATIELMTVRAS
jgi:hypothetical protein